jgi:hypothetical protein
MTDAPQVSSPSNTRPDPSANLPPLTEDEMSALNVGKDFDISKFDKLEVPKDAMNAAKSPGQLPGDAEGVTGKAKDVGKVPQQAEEAVKDAKSKASKKGEEAVKEGKGKVGKMGEDVKKKTGMQSRAPRRRPRGVKMSSRRVETLPRRATTRSRAARASSARPATTSPRRQRRPLRTETSLRKPET